MIEYPEDLTPEQLEVLEHLCGEDMADHAADARRDALAMIRAFHEPGEDGLDAVLDNLDCAPCTLYAMTGLLCTYITDDGGCPAEVADHWQRHWPGEQVTS
jgi:hypothetical protein